MLTSPNLSLSVTTKAAALSAVPSWGLLPPLGNLNAYLAAVNRFPLLTAEEETHLATRLQEENDLQAASRLVLSHLRLVVSISRQYLGYGLPQADLIQEGNIGLMKAVRRFDPSKGVRLMSYALHWIKAEIHEYIIKNWRMVKLATTKAQRKLFFKLRSLKNSLHDAVEESAETTLSTAQIKQVAQELQVKPEEVREMEMRLQGGDVVLDAPATDNEDAQGVGKLSPVAYLSDPTQEPLQILEKREREQLANTGLKNALSVLDARARAIVQARWLSTEEGTSGATLHELAARFKVSAERVRQIEAAAIKKMRTFFEGSNKALVGVAARD